MDLTVRRVATFFLDPWWISIWTRSWPFLFLGRVKVTAMWDRSLTSLPIIALLNRFYIVRSQLSWSYLVVPPQWQFSIECESLHSLGWPAALLKRRTSSWAAIGYCCRREFVVTMLTAVDVRNSMWSKIILGILNFSLTNIILNCIEPCFCSISIWLVRLRQVKFMILALPESSL